MALLDLSVFTAMRPAIVSLFTRAKLLLSWTFLATSCIYSAANERSLSRECVVLYTQTQEGEGSALHLLRAFCERPSHRVVSSFSFRYNRSRQRRCNTVGSNMPTFHYCQYPAQQCRKDLHGTALPLLFF